MTLKQTLTMNGPEQLSQAEIANKLQFHCYKIAGNNLPSLVYNFDAWVCKTITKLIIENYFT